MTVTGIETCWWTKTADDLLALLKSSSGGLTDSQVKARLEQYGLNSIMEAGPPSAIALLLRQFRGSLVITLVAAAVIAGFVGEFEEASIILIIVLFSCVLSFFQEYRASKIMEDLRAQLASKSRLLRGGKEVEVPSVEVVPGDQAFLSAGCLIPADGVILDAVDLTVSEASLTGEAFPVEKLKGRSPPDASLAQRTNAVFCGTSVRSGYGRYLVTATGRNTVFASIAHDVLRDHGQTAFALGIRNFGNMLTRVMLAIVVVVFAINQLLHRPLIDSLLFSVALGVGMTPELLPAIMSVTLAYGARKLAASGVMVRNLGAIENLGSINMFCTDKTGTLTAGRVVLEKAAAFTGQASREILELAYRNASLQSGMKNPIDDAILAAAREFASGPQLIKIGEVPYDFNRKRLTVICRENVPGAQTEMICKGALKEVLSICTKVASGKRVRALTVEDKERALSFLKSWSAEGFRVLALATRKTKENRSGSYSDEAEFTLRGYLIFTDEIKPGIADIIGNLKERGVSTRILTGDNRYAAAHVARAVGMKADRILTGEDLAHLTRSALEARVARSDIYAELDPSQKERVILALRKRGNIVGYLGDGINDAPALRAADIGISVDNAVDVAREAADFVLLEKDLTILLKGIEDGRTIFANTLKYISITMSANFGNMISMAIASSVLPFLPMLAKQILLNNLLSDLPALAIAGDNVDREDIESPHGWHVGAIQRFMITFGLISSAFDGLSFLFLSYLANATETVFQTAWFILSLASEVGIVLVLRTRKSMLLGKPSALLVFTSLLVLLSGAFLVTSPFLAPALGFAPVGEKVWIGMAVIVTAYLMVSEFLKQPVRRWTQRSEVAPHN